MSLYVCRWPNGDFSIVQAADEEQAIEMLDEMANAEGVPLYPISDFMVHFWLTDSGSIELQSFGDDFESHLSEHIYPTLSEVEMSFEGNVPADDPRIKAAVKAERDRIKRETTKEPDTEIGKRIRTVTDMPTSVVNRKVQTVARKMLRKTKLKGKPN